MIHFMSPLFLFNLWKKLYKCRSNQTYNFRRVYRQKDDKPCTRRTNNYKNFILTLYLFEIIHYKQSRKLLKKCHI